MFSSNWLGALKRRMDRTFQSKGLSSKRRGMRTPKPAAVTLEALEERILLAVDFGDAPDTGAGTGAGNYETLLANLGPSHTVVSGLMLGANVDMELDAQPNAQADGDDIDQALPDDEDGVFDPLDLRVTVGAPPAVTLLATNTTGSEATLYGWIDFNNDGSFDNATERASVPVPDASTNQSFTLAFPSVPSGFTGGTYARFRLSTDVAAADPTGAASDGEVEDYQAEIFNPTTLEGRKWHDLNANGVLDANEPFLSGQTIELIDHTGAVIATDVTDANGRYQFTGLVPGPYVVREVLQDGWIQSSPTFQTSLTTTGTVSGEWDYDDNDGNAIPGPANWQLVAPTVLGDFQSPVDIPANTPTVDLYSVLERDYRPEVPEEIFNNGRTIEAGFEHSAENSIILNGEVFELLQFHFHTASEHTVAGQREEMELHLVHQHQGGGGLAVIGIRLTADANTPENTALAPVFDQLVNLPNRDDEVPGVEEIDVNALFPASSQGWFYEGSLTTPPGSQGVNWFVFEQPVEISMAQFQAYLDVANNDPNNDFDPGFRPVQPLNGRQFNQFNHEVMVISGTPTTDVNFGNYQLLPDTIGSVDTLGNNPSGTNFAFWYLRSSNDSGPPDVSNDVPFAYGLVGWLPVTGDWNADGIDTIGIVDPTGNPNVPASRNGLDLVWHLRNSNDPGAADVNDAGPMIGAVDPFIFGYGGANWTPVVGDWDGNGSDTIGAVDPTDRTEASRNGVDLVWYLRNSNSPGSPDIQPFNYGAFNWIPVVGDWDGDGTETVGVFDPDTATWYLRNSNDPGAPDIEPFAYGLASWTPVVGDWDGDGTTTVGVVDPNGVWYLRNSNDSGAVDITPFAYGLGNWSPVSGVWAQPQGQALRAAQSPLNPEAEVLSDTELQTTVVGALQLLEDSGVDSSVIDRLAAAEYRVTDLPGDLLGWTDRLNHRVWVDANAAGRGWNPGTSSTTQESEGYDLLSAVLHEMGHLDGLQHQDEGLLEATLEPGLQFMDGLDELFRKGL
jgi:carbonic anhydrase